MQCPTCNLAFAMSGRQGIEIDYCPQCRGVWLGRDELDKILQSGAGNSAASSRHENAGDRTQQLLKELFNF